MKFLIATGFAFVFATLAPAAAADDSSTFDKLKAMAGTWTGPAQFEGGSMPMTVKFRVTSGGSTVEETIAPGSEHEMITMYYMEGKSLVLTHYCTMGNQPHMKLAAGSEGSVLKFEFAGGANIKPGGGHMDSHTFEFMSADHVKSKWFALMGGKPMMHIVMDLQRSSTSANR
jgi:hypothetical protein